MGQKIGTSQFKPSIINSNFTPQATRFSTASGSYVLVTGCSLNYTSGPTPERLLLWLNVMAISGTGNAEITMFAAGVEQRPHMYIDPGSPWARVGQQYVVDVAANTTITLDVRASSAGGTMYVTNETVNWIPTIRGFSI